MRWNKNGYTVTVRINLFAVGDGGGDLCTADPGSSHADIACFVVDTLAGVICRSTVTAGITGNAGVDNHRGGRGIVDCPAGDCGAVAWAEMAAERKRISAVDLSSSIERKMAVAAGHCAGFAGLQPLAMPELAAVALRRACAGNGDAGDCCLVAVGRGCGNYSRAR
uniref:Uncharacterized protein n=1 Tax=Panagrolaimus superbus TaxID=310955 RepID=A0A914YVQ4_9BILA